MFNPQLTNRNIRYIVNGNRSRHGLAQQRHTVVRKSSVGREGSRGLDICVIGAGVVGLTSAVRLAEEVSGSRVTVVAERFGGNTTSHGAAGLWQPYKVAAGGHHLHS